VVNTDEILQGVLTLLADYQTNIPKQENYYRVVNKITDNSGIQVASNINAVYDPSYQSLRFHSIQIVRDGKIIDKLVPEHFQVMRRELNAENYLYDGSLSAMLNLSDVRKGDIIDYSYSITGFNPIHKGKYANTFTLSDYGEIGKINVSILAKSDLNYKVFNSEIEPVISRKKGYSSYQWAVENPENILVEDNVPAWKIVAPILVVSQYSSWAAVEDWAKEIYLPKKTLSSDLKAEIDHLISDYNTEGDKIKSILNFVQNEIRYLGIENGIGGYMPNPPNQVFQQRYGDCKDKSLLMVEMLKEINIKAYPMLINTSLKATIEELPPSPQFFDHCVVKVIDNNDRVLYYDPTISNQGGSYLNTYFPDYGYGLVVGDDHKGFDIIQPMLDNKVTTEETFTVEEMPGGATLEVVTTYTDSEADNIRNLFLNRSKAEIAKEFENYYARFYPKIDIVGMPVLEDDVIKNELKVIESYTIDSIWKPMKLKPGFMSVEFIPSSLMDVIYKPNLQNRIYALGLPYPSAREHKTKIKLPSKWQIQEENDMISNDAFYYDYSIKHLADVNEIHLKSYLKIQKPSVAPNEFMSFERDLNNLDKSFGFLIFKNPNLISSGADSLSFSFGQIIFGLLFLAVLLGIVIRILLKKNKTTTHP
jgi:hypothetical protein